jgi:hypothetical protein
MTEPEHDETEPEDATADAPADEDEAAESDEAGASEPEPEHEPQETTPEAWEKRFRDAERRFKTYQSAVERIWEEDSVHLAVFPIGTAAPPGFIDTREAGRVPDEIKTAILSYLGVAREQDYKQHPQLRACDVCDAKGNVRTGSTVAGREKVPCPACAGYGYFPPPTPGTNGVATTIGPVLAPDAQIVPLSHPDRDMWGEREFLPDGRPNPNYQRLPDAKITVEPYGITRLIPDEAWVG